MKSLVSIICALCATCISLTVVKADPIHDAAKSGDITAIESLLASGVSIESSSAVGTALHSAVRSGELAAVKYLLSKSADANAESILGSPLLLAARKDQLDIAKALLDAGADTNAGKKTTPIIVAAKRGNSALVELLLKNKANPNITPNLDGYRALHEAARGGHQDIVRLLLHHDADPNVMTARYETAHHFAVFAGHDEIAHLLQGITNPTIESKIDEADVSAADLQQGKNLTQHYCGNCHSVGADIRNNRGPHLWNIIGVMSGEADPDYAYSSVIRQRKLVWDIHALDKFLLAPSGFMPGTKMNIYPVENPATRIAIIAYIRSLPAR